MAPSGLADAKRSFASAVRRWGETPQFLLDQPQTALDCHPCSNNMRYLYGLCFLVWLAPVLAMGADTIEVSDHQVIGIAPAIGQKVETIIVKLAVRYSLTSKSRATIKLVVDRDAEMTFVMVDQKEVSMSKKKKSIDLVFRLEKFPRDLARGIVLIQDPNAPEGTKPLAMTGLSLEVKKFKYP